MDPIRPISPTDRAIPPVELTRLDPLEREREKQRRERERRRRQAAAQQPSRDPDAPGSGVDFRA